MNKSILLAAGVALASTTLADTILNFNGQSSTGNNQAFAPNADGTYDWVDQGASFSLEVSFSGAAWDGITYSSVNNTTTAGFLNQYAVYGDGMGRGDTGSYAIYANPFTPRPVISLPVATTVLGFYANNTTYAALSMLNGDGFARSFTTASNDWFQLTIEGFDSGDVSQGSVDFLLADYTGATGAIIEDWAFIDLTSLGNNVRSLGFSLSSSDNNAFGMKTPAYFAMDDLTVAAIPEPESLGLMLSALGGLVLFRRRMKR